MSRITVVLLLALATSALAQNYPMPASVAEVPPVCTGCRGTNYSGETNDGLPTWPYGAPLDFVGRFHDSTLVDNYQHTAGMRTLRARTVRVVPERNRIYVQLGEMVAAYDLDTFFTERLPEGMVSVNTINTGTTVFRNGGVYEKLARQDAFFYAEASTSGWEIPGAPDMQRALYGYDLDDRGYLYVATAFGWGIHEDDGRTDGTHMPFVSKNTQDAATLIFAFRSGETYYAVGSESLAFTRRIRVYDVTNPAAPVHLHQRSNVWIRAFAKDDVSQRLAIIDNSNMLRVYSYAGFAANQAPLVEYNASTGLSLSDVTFDDSGNVWAVEGGGGAADTLLWKLPADSLVRTTYDVYGSTFAGSRVHASAGYVAVTGLDSDLANGVRLFEVQPAGTPVQVGLDDYFRKYYFRSPAGYAQPWIYQEAAGARIVKHGAKTYLMQSAGTLGDAYELPTHATSVSGLFPASGPPAGGTTVTISGINLEGTPSVTFGGVNATSVTATNGRIFATAPPHAPGAVNVVVTYPGGSPIVAPQPFTYVLEGPRNFVATGATVSVELSWDAVEGATTYELSRRIGDAWEVVSTQAGTGYTDGSVSSAMTYVYRIRALDGTYASAYAMDVATTVPMSTANVTAGMPVLASHITDVQNGVNALRAAAGLAAATFPSVTAGTTILATHITDPRAAVLEARAALGLTTSFTDDPPAIVRAIHVQELLDAVR